MHCKISIATQKLKKDEKTNIEASKKRLEYFNFPYRDQIINRLELIKNDRNDLFHGLLRLPEKGLMIHPLAKRINNNLSELIKLWKLFVDDIKI